MSYSTRLDHTELSIVIPLYIHKIELYPIIQRCFDSIKEHYPNAELVVIDDGSPLEHDFEVTYRKPKNSGFTNTVNEGLHRATNDIIVVMNDDITLKAGDLDRFYEINAVGIYSPKTEDEGDGDKFGSIWGMNRETYKRMGNLDEKFPHYFSDTEYYKKAKRLEIPITKWYDIVITHESGATYEKLDNREELYDSDKAKYDVS